MKMKWGNETLDVRVCKTGRIRGKKQCAMCGKSFLSARNTARYCSNKCRVAFHRLYSV